LHLPCREEFLPESHGFARQADTLVITVPPAAPDPHDSVVVLDLAGN